jgi:hypothetical protein
VINDGGIVGAPPAGRWVVVCEALSRRGRRSHKKSFHANFIGPDQ